jgi:pyridoxine 5-phosphate synthase
MSGLTVNIDQIATLRMSRKASSPDPVAGAILAELAGADGIEASLRGDRQHIQDRDIRILRHVVQTKLILKMASSPEMAGIAMNVKPDFVTLVPEKREEFTAEGGLDLMVHQNMVAETIETLQNSGIPVSVLIDSDPEQIKLAHQINVPMVEIHTGTYCGATTSMRKNQAFSKIVIAVKLAHRLKIIVNASQGLCYTTIKDFKDLPEINEFIIGHSIISRAVFVGMEKAVKEMKDLIKELRVEV